VGVLEPAAGTAEGLEERVHGKPVVHIVDLLLQVHVDESESGLDARELEGRVGFLYRQHDARLDRAAVVGGAFARVFRAFLGAHGIASVDDQNIQHGKIWAFRPSPF